MAKKRIYRASPGATFTNKEAAVVGRSLERIGKRITPGDVVKAAFPVESPLHKFFEWDDTAAAVQHRLFQARNLVNHLEVVVVNSAGKEQQIKSWFSQIVNTNDDDLQPVAERKYVHISIIEANSSEATSVVETAKRELLSWQRRYNQFAEHFQPVFLAIEKLD